MLLKKVESIYILYNSEKILDKMSDRDFIKLMCSDNTLVYKNQGIYIFDDWDVLKKFSKNEICVACELVNKMKLNDVYLRITNHNTSLIVTNTDFIHDKLHNQVWINYDDRNIMGIFTCILVQEGKELNDYICVISSDEDHEKNMEFITIKVKDEAWFENYIIPKFQSIFEDLKVII